ncbi:MAG TPA: type II toxin-antitoxin system HipA family toxin [Campylobacterales bacterium]|nr:type II toxin-antitoxin system HipA family toxin [Campylobacterales bacterium]
MNKYEKIIIESFEQKFEQSISELFDSTGIPKRTLNRYLDTLIFKGEIKAIGEGRGRYYQRIFKPRVNQIAVFKSGELVGFLGHEVGRYLFEYEKRYTGRRLDGLGDEGVLTSATLFPIFENLIPESDRRNAYVVDGQNLAEILLELENTHGDFDFVSADKLHGFKMDYSNCKQWVLVKENILGENEFFNILNFDIAIEREVLEEKGKHSSLSGYQNKIDVNIDFEKAEIKQSSDALYLLKPYNSASAVYNFRDKNQTHLPYMGLNEHLFMSFAKNAYGFDVPWSGVVIGERDFHYVVKRYDRYGGYKYEQRDFAQIMNIKSDQKYFTTSEKLFDTIAKVVKSKEERVRFLEFYIFSFVIEHADLHLKNISILNMGRDKYRLSPLYDLISNGVYRGDSDELGLPLGGKKKNISLASFYQLSERIGISKLQTKKIVKRVIGIFIEEFPTYIEKSSKITAFDNLKIQKNRYSFGDFSTDLQKFYDRRMESLRQRGLLKELGL